jgi:hypothetical protein
MSPPQSEAVTFIVTGRRRPAKRQNGRRRATQTQRLRQYEVVPPLCDPAAASESEDDGNRRRAERNSEDGVEHGEIVTGQTHGLTPVV